MSGYNNKTGIFELTYTKAEYWHRKPIDAAIPYTGMRYFVEVLRKAGLDVSTSMENLSQKLKELLSKFG